MNDGRGEKGLRPVLVLHHFAGGLFLMARGHGEQMFHF